MITSIVETTSAKAAAVKYKKRWLKYRADRRIDRESIWMFIDGSSTGWHAAVILDPFTKKITRIAEHGDPKSRNIGPELWSLLIGLKAVDPTKPLVVVHDYIGTGAWLAGAWKIKSVNVRAAVDDIEAVIEAREFTSIKFIHHGGHQKDHTDFTRWNEEADQLCNNQEVVHTTVDWVTGL